MPEEQSINNRFVILSDTGNDTECVDATLKFSGILKKDTTIEQNMEGMSVIHTGDFLDKKAPDLKVLEYFEALDRKVTDQGGFMKILAGNHEHEVWQKIVKGETFSIKGEPLFTLQQIIESIDLFYVDGPLLFIHSYPTVEFLKSLLKYKNETSNNLNRFNDDCYRKAFNSVSSLYQYSYVRDGLKKGYLLYEPLDIEGYFRKNGTEIVDLLKALEIDCIVHGHKPQQSGKQIDYEFQKWLPGIRIIGNDTKVREQGIGATIIRMDLGRESEVVFINSSNTNKKTRNKVKYLLRNSAPVSDAFCKQFEKIQHFKKRQKRLESLLEKHKDQIVSLESEIQEQQTSNLLLREELAERVEQIAKIDKEMQLYQGEIGKLKKEILVKDEKLTIKIKNKQSSSLLLKEESVEYSDQLREAYQKLEILQHQKKELEAELSIKQKQLITKAQIVSKTESSLDKHNQSTKQELAELKSTNLRLQKKLRESNLTRKQAVGYLRVCHDKSQQIFSSLEQCRNDKKTSEALHAEILEQESRLRQKIEKSRRILKIYSVLTTVVFFCLLLLFQFMDVF